MKPVIGITASWNEEKESVVLDVYKRQGWGPSGMGLQVKQPAPVKAL